MEMIRPIVSGSIQLTRTRSMKVIALSAYRDPIRPLILAKRWSDINAAIPIRLFVMGPFNFLHSTG